VGISKTVFVPPLPVSLNELKQRITTAVESADEDMLRSVWTEVSYRIDMSGDKRLKHSEPCPRDSAQGRLNAEISLLKFCPVTTFPRLSYGIGCCERAKGLGTVLASCCRATENQAHTSVSSSTRRYNYSSGEEASHPRGTYLAESSTLPTGPTIEYGRKLEIQFRLGIYKMAFGLFGVHTRRWPGVQGQGRRGLLFVYCRL